MAERQIQLTFADNEPRMDALVDVLNRQMLKVQLAGGKILGEPRFTTVFSSYKINEVEYGFGEDCIGSFSYSVPEHRVGEFASFPDEDDYGPQY